MKFGRNRIIFILILSIVAFATLYYQFFVPKPVTSVEIGNENLKFRLDFTVDLREASKVPVYPSEDALYREIMHGLVQNITIAFKPVESENAYYAISAYEIVTKLRRGYQLRNLDPGFNTFIINDSYEYLPGKIQNPIVALVHPNYSDETSVKVEGHVISIEGKTQHEFNLATAKFLMAVLGIEV